MNKIVKNLTIQNYKNFKSSFENTKEIFWDEERQQLLHPGEFGTYRENIAKEWLRIYIPQRFDLGTGFVITPKNRISSQCDIVIFDRTITPKVENSDNQKFFPIEGISGVIEMKSDINSISELNEHLKKLSKFKELRGDVEDPDPYYRANFKTPFSLEANPFDNIFTILICNTLNFKFDVDSIDYGNIPIKYHHNLILSLNDGLINYKTTKGTPNLYMSFANNINHNYHFLKNDLAEFPSSIIIFLTSLHSLLVHTTITNIDMSYYLQDEPLKEII